jgi:hypothetical protein
MDFGRGGVGDISENRSISPLERSKVLFGWNLFQLTSRARSAYSQDVKMKSDQRNKAGIAAASRSRALLSQLATTPRRVLDCLRPSRAVR